MRLGSLVFAITLLFAWVLLPNSSFAQAAGDPPSAEGAEKGGEGAQTGPDPANRPKAEEHFKRGLQLQGEEAWTAALAEFMRSRELYPTRAATNNVAFCLRKLKRFDEALDMYQTLLREYPNMTADKKEAVQKEVAELRTLVGTIDIKGGEPGALIMVDGRERADYPLLDPLRVAAGTHTVKLFKQGFQPFETSIEVAGGETVTVEAKMPALVASGQLKVSEKSGLKLDVILDGATVGVTPWQGTVAVGEHVIQLLGDGDIGSPPTAAPVKKDDVTTLTLESTPLEAEMIVKVSPAGATIRVDSVNVGSGIWDGRLTTGSHTVEVLLEGYFSKRQSVSLEKGDRKEVALTLERDEDADAWQVPSKFVLDLTGGVLLTPSFGGDVSSTCEGECTQGVGFGGVLWINGTYEFPMGVGIGLSVGMMQASQSIQSRETTLYPVGIDPGLSGRATDELRLRGVLAGAHVSYRYGEEFPFRARLGAGVLIGQARSIRDGTFITRDQQLFTAPTLLSQQTTPFVYIDPEVSIGFTFAEKLEFSLGVQGLILIPPTAPTWGGDENQSFVVDGDGISSYSADETTMGPMVFIVPGAALRASF